MDAVAKARMQMLGAALLFSTGGAAIKACDLTGWQVACFRSGVGAIALALFLPASRRRWTWRTGVVAVAYAATLILYVLANKLTTAANAIFLQSTAPLYLLLIAPYLLREPIRRRDLFFMCALGVGLALFFVGMEPPQKTAPDPFLGNVLGAAAAVTWALTVAGLRWLARAERHPGGSPSGAAAGAAVAGNALVFLVALPFALPVEQSTVTDWVWIAYLGAFQIGLAYLFMTAGVRRVPALEASLLLLVEPVLNTVWAFLVHGEVPAPWSLVGALVILVATAVHAVAAARGGSERRRQSAPEA
ncbi:MAG: EamA family transporter [Planctomycetota bacterium]|nr:EamA family transporter [Planctomycetota bacterium]